MKTSFPRKIAEVGGFSHGAKEVALLVQAMEAEGIGGIRDLGDQEKKAKNIDCRK